MNKSEPKSGKVLTHFPEWSSYSAIERAYSQEKRRYGLSERLTAKERKALSQSQPFQQLIGEVNFDGMPIKLRQGVFIPREETLEVVNFAKRLINEESAVLDLCTGSGYIGLALKKATGASLTLSDINATAVSLARFNARRLGLKVRVIQSDLFMKVTGTFDLIIANPPYIPEHTVLPASVVQYEPGLALWGGLDGSDFYRRIIEQAPTFLRPHGVLVFEISRYNKDYIEAAGFTVIHDLNGEPRIAWRKHEG